MKDVVGQVLVREPRSVQFLWLWGLRVGWFVAGLLAGISLRGLLW